ncbi:MAG: YdcF family protein [Cyclobacteriaceae bacterium]
MFFILSKVLLFLIQPLNWIVGVLLASWIIKSSIWKKRLFVAGMVLLLFFTNGFISNTILKAWEVEPVPIAQLPVYKAGIILTGVTDREMKPRDRVYFHKGADRVTHALHLYRIGKIEKILISGGNSEIIPEDDDVAEADNIVGFFTMTGVPREDILIDNKARNTHESAINCKKILEDKYPGARHLVITSAFHMRRAKPCYDKVGLTVDDFSCDFNTGRGEEFSLFDVILPTAGAIQQWNILLKEWVGIVAYKLQGYI